MDFENAHALLYARFGGDTARWFFSADSNALRLGPATGSPTVTTVLDSHQADMIRSITDIETKIVLSVRVFGESLQLHLAGKQANVSHWIGIASIDPAHLGDEAIGEQIEASFPDTVVQLSEHNQNWRQSRRRIG